MQRISRSILWMMVLLLAFLTPVSGQEETEPLITDEEVIIIPATEYKMEMNSTRNISYSINLEDSYSTIITSSHDDIVRVSNTDSEISMTARGVGTSTITILVMLEGLETHYERVITVTVSPLTGTISFKENVFYLIRNLYYDIEYEITPSTIDKSNVVWTSSNPEVATVVNGRVTGLNIGKTTITAKLDDHVETMELHVTVPLEKMEFNPSQISFELNATRNLPNLIYVPYDTTTPKNVTYHIEDETIVSLKNGVLTGLKVGGTQIIARVGKIEAVLQVVVEQPKNATGTQILMLEIDDANNNGLFLGVSTPETYNNSRYDLSLPVESILSYMENRNYAVIHIMLEDAMIRDNFTYFNQLTVSENILSQLSNKKLEINFVDEDQTPLIRYIFDRTSETPINLGFNLEHVSASNTLLKDVKQEDAMSLKIKEHVRSPYMMGINHDYFKGETNQLHFIYQYNGHLLTDTEQTSMPLEDGLVMFMVYNNHLIVSLQPIGRVNSSIVIYILILAVATIFVYISWKVVNDMSKRRKNML